MDLENLIVRFRNKIENSKNPIMFFDSDCDGISSYLQLKKKWGKIKGYNFQRDESKQLELLSKIKGDCDLVIFFDIPEISEKFLQEIRTIKVLWQDHHLKDVSKILQKNENIIYLNPTHFDEKINTPSSQTAYEITDLKENIELCFFGSLSDFFLLENLIEFEKYNKVLFDKIFNINILKKKEIFRFIKNNDPYDEKLYEKRKKYIEFLIYKTNFFKIRNFFDFLFKMNRYDIKKSIEKISKLNFETICEGVLSNSDTFPFNKFFELEKEFLEIYGKITLKIKKKYFLTYLKKNKLLYVSYFSKKSFTKILIETIVSNYKNFEVYMVSKITEEKGYAKISFRSFGNVDVNRLLLTSLNGIKGTGGGHKFSCACNIHLVDYDKFIENVKTNLDIILKK